MLNRLRDAATMAISVTTGRKLNITNKNSTASNVITGFGYALMDIFENQFVDMDSIVKKNDEIEEVKSPFISPAKKRKEKGMSKEEWKKKRREDKKREQEEKERREKEPPK
jgi:carbonic anhydrase/acetyltransferase-like protein (isoleucine patch superfamily)